MRRVPSHMGFLAPLECSDCHDGTWVRSLVVLALPDGTHCLWWKVRADAPPHIVAHCVWPVEILDSSVLIGVIRIVPCDLADSLQVTSPLEGATYMLVPLLLVCAQ